jgi:hypothetical protein
MTEFSRCAAAAVVPGLAAGAPAGQEQTAGTVDTVVRAGRLIDGPGGAPRGPVSIPRTAVAR